jgi:hypothetical protein
MQIFRLVNPIANVLIWQRVKQPLGFMANELPKQSRDVFKEIPILREEACEFNLDGAMQQSLLVS